MNHEISLCGDWEFSQVGRDRCVDGWRPATVPGTVHTDLLANGLIHDPFYRDNESDMAWIEQARWSYRRSFDIPAHAIRSSKRIELAFLGLDTFASIRLNGKVVGQADNMFRPWCFDVTRQVRAGRNRIEVDFASPVRVAEEKAAKSRIRYHTVFYENRMHIRKSQYAGGWDWGPRLMTSGIWRPVCLRAVGTSVIRDVHVITRELTGKRALLDIEVQIEAFERTRGSVDVSLRCPKTKNVVEASRRVSLERGTKRTRIRLELQNPQRWWPAGMGDPHLYDLEVTLSAGGELFDRKEDRLGLRSVELVREKDSQGESFRFRVNGREVFARGANWIPGDSFLPRVTPEYYRDRLTQARDANMNMIRVWGGGVYEDPTFYRTCDELGLMVWQDFMFACAEYPEDASFLSSVRDEAEHAVRGLRNHPSIVIWCGNNENEWLYQRKWPQSPRFRGARIYHELLPEVCRQLDPSRPYWPGSPTGGDDANDPNRGNQHVWTVWSFWAAPHDYWAWPARFVTEFGFQGAPAMKTMRSFTNESDRWLFSPVLDRHNKMLEGNPRLMKYLAGGYGVPSDLEELVHWSQVQQAEIIKLGVEHWRRRWPASAGAVFWQLNDCWPVTSWAAIDYFGRPKGLLYAARRFFAPVVISLRPSSGKPYGPDDLEVWISQDHRRRDPVKVEATAWDIGGERLGHRTIGTRLPAGCGRMVGVLSYQAMGLDIPERGCVHVQLSENGSTLAENVHWFAPAKYIDWPEPGLKVICGPVEGGLGIEVSAKRVARGVCLEVDRWEGRLTDNFFDLMPGHRRSVKWLAEGQIPDLAEFRKHMRTKWLRSARRALPT